VQLKERRKNHLLWNAVREWGSFVELGFQADINAGTLSRIANGFRPPTPAQERKICTILGKTPLELGFSG